MLSQFLSFVPKAPTAFHATEQLCERLEDAGAIRLHECDHWQLKRGQRYFVTRNRSAVIAFDVPQDDFSSFRIVASHSDSPMFKLKANAEEAVSGRYVRLNTERYGGMIFSSWFDRPLSIAGRVVVRAKGGLATRLVDLARDAAIIPNMPIHFNREVNDGYRYNAQTDLLPLFAQDNPGRLLKDIAEVAQVDSADIVASDLFLYNRMQPARWDAFFACPRIDDLECAWTSMQAFLNVRARAQINVCAVLDNEEVGSGTKQGADSSFLGDVLYRAAASLGMDDAQTRAAIASGFMVSADNAHAVHPNHPEKFDATNRVYMNEGVVIKHNANQKYTTDAVSNAIFSEICTSAGVKVQHFANRSDILGGSTLGNIANSHISMNTVDIGLAQLAMHSAYETAGAADISYMVQALTAFYGTRIQNGEDGAFCLDSLS